tara:strand:+ start:232 stop:513 length:282 start_codon:yes stop_codon:yes gene_type:complete
MKAIKKVNKNGTFRFELESGDVLVKSTKRELKSFVYTYRSNDRIKANYQDKNSSKKGFTLVKFVFTDKKESYAMELFNAKCFDLSGGYLIALV